MIDDKIISASTNSLRMFDELGPIAITIFFTLIILFVGGIFIKYVLKDIGIVVKNNTEAMRDLSNNINRDFSDIKNKQVEIHSDIKEILHNLRYKYGINDFNKQD